LTPRRLVLATANPDKVVEIANLMSGFELLPRPAGLAEPEECADTLEGNARIKALAVVEATGQAAVADDTGLEVAALQGGPGVRSARYAGPDATYEDNVALLLAALANAGDRRARFRTVALAMFPDGREVKAEGSVEGTIAVEARGDHGFGYDPVFVPDGAANRTYAELTTSEKNIISHRAMAFIALAADLRRMAPWPQEP